MLTRAEVLRRSTAKCKGVVHIQSAVSEIS